MNWIIKVNIIVTVLKAALCYNIEPLAWKYLNNAAKGFGYQVVQRQSDFLVSAPFEQYSPDRRGQVFRCTTDRCENLQVEVPDWAVNMSLGLTMTSDPYSDKTMVCGPTIPKDCKSITTYNGLCIEIRGQSTLQPPLPSSNAECQTQADIAFLMDESASVNSTQFKSMKTFVSKMIESLLGKDIQFAVAKYAEKPDVRYSFKTFDSKNWQAQINSIDTIAGRATNTAAAITHMVDTVFSSNHGSRPEVKKVLIVITDGKSHDSKNLPAAKKKAESKNIVRFAIGVGEAFKEKSALDELKNIASEPDKDFVFKVETFEALDKIQQNLQDKIFSIEGSQTSGESLKLEMSQEGFRAAYIIGGIQTAIIGANQWRGGFKQYAGKVTSYQPMARIEPDSYLGYSMAVAKTADGQLTIIGAPRYQHRGVVAVVSKETLLQKIEPNQQARQVGEYFGGEVCTMDTNLDSMTDLIIISAPMYKDSDREGRVYICELLNFNVDCHFESPVILKGVASDRGRFGSSLAVLPDLNNDGFSDLAVGAPLENDGQGSIYIFNAERSQRINPTYSQRIPASEVQSGLQFFGMSISQSTFDQSGDGLPDLVVGSKGAVVLLRSRPIVMVEATVSFTPNEIPILNVDCSKALDNTAKICFTMSKQPYVDTAQARINYTLTLDATRMPPNHRAYVTESQQALFGSLLVDLNKQNCASVKFFIKECQEDIRNPLLNELKFVFMGSPSKTGLTPSLSRRAKTTTLHPLAFKNSCGSDKICTDDLKVDFNFTRSIEVTVGVDEQIAVTVSVENRREDSQNPHVILTYPPGISFRKFSALQGRVECNSVDSENGLNRGKTDCAVNKPILQSNSKVVFNVTYGIGVNSQLGRKIIVAAKASSMNQLHSPSSELHIEKEIAVKYSIFVSVESLLNYVNFTFGTRNVQRPVEQSIKVTNNIRSLNFTVVIRVPFKLGDQNIWVDFNSVQITDCQRGQDEEPVVIESIAQIKEDKVVDCSVAQCGVFRCNRFMGRLETKTYTVTANLSSAWTEQIGLPSAKFHLTSTASLEYDMDQYVFITTGTDNNPPVHKMKTEVEVYPEPDFTKEIIGASLGGLAFLATLTAGLYKAGFFKSKYKNMINEQGDVTGDGGEVPGGAPTVE